jgi:hypothetical protein
MSAIVPTLWEYPLMRIQLFVAFLIQALAAAPAQADGGVPDTRPAAVVAAELEKAFWVCDYAGTNGVVDPMQGAACIAITDEFKRVQFDGDLDRLVAWWSLHKIARHQELMRAQTAVVEQKHAGDGI